MRVDESLGRELAVGAAVTVALSEKNTSVWVAVCVAQALEVPLLKMSRRESQGSYSRPDSVGKAEGRTDIVG